MSKQPPSAPTTSAIGLCPTIIQIVGRPGTGSLPRTIVPPQPPLRDTGASQFLILASVLIQGVECGFVNVPLHNIYLSSDLVKGPVAVGIRQTLPFKGVHLFLGNDLAGDKVVVNPLVTNTTCMDQAPDSIEQELPDLYPSCAVTRAMAKKAID